MLVEIGINTIKSDYFKTVKDIDRIETILIFNTIIMLII